MATQSATFTFALPEDPDSDQLLIYSSSTETGTYSLATTVAYTYGTTEYEYDSFNDTLWYKIKFNNSDDSEAGPLSDAVYGGNFANAAPFLAVSTTTDGANYATIQDVYEYSGLTATEATPDAVSKALRRARALIDHFCNEMSLDRYNIYDIEIARKKYNAALRILREAEINIALGVLYRSLSDDTILDGFRNADNEVGGVSIGDTSLDGANTNIRRPENIAFLAALADRYSRTGRALLDALQPKSIAIRTQAHLNSSSRRLLP